mmetsp:Transcript_32293/g.49100  ORF Transcript_32293/g.49100 Transcript_32293/m.49100 type:complete len:453 (+) Transcript_32293:72-1430(+)
MALPDDASVLSGISENSENSGVSALWEGGGDDGVRTDWSGVDFALIPGMSRESIGSAYSLMDEVVRGGVLEHLKIIEFEREFGYDFHLIRTRKGETFPAERGKVDYIRGKTISGGTTALYFRTQGQRGADESNPLNGLILPLFKEDDHARIFFESQRYLNCVRQALPQGKFKKVVSFSTVGVPFGGQNVKTLVDKLNVNTDHFTYMDSNELPSKPGSYLKGEIVGDAAVGNASVTSGYPRNHYWKESYREAMGMASQMFFIITDGWINSDNCLQELHWALELERPEIQHFLVYFDQAILGTFYEKAAEYLAANSGANYVEKLQGSRPNDNGFFVRKYRIGGQPDAHMERIASLVRQPVGELLPSTPLQAEPRSINLRRREMLQGPNIGSLIERVASLETKVDRITTILEQQMGRNVSQRPNVSQGRNVFQGRNVAQRRNQGSNEDVSINRWV